MQLLASVKSLSFISDYTKYPGRVNFLKPQKRPLYLSVKSTSAQGATVGWCILMSPTTTRVKKYLHNAMICTALYPLWPTPLKCHVAAENMMYLDYYISRNCVHVDSDKFKVTNTYTVPKSVPELRGFSWCLLRTPISAKYCWFGWWLGAWSTPSHHPTQLCDIYIFWL